jgi:hypothetical protein
MKKIHSITLASALFFIAVYFFGCATLSDINDGSTRVDTNFRVTSGRETTPREQLGLQTNKNQAAINKKRTEDIISGKNQSNEEGQQSLVEKRSIEVRNSNKVVKCPPFEDAAGNLLGWLINTTGDEITFTIYDCDHNSVFFKGLRPYGHEKIYLPPGEYTVKFEGEKCEQVVHSDIMMWASYDVVDKGVETTLNSHFIAFHKYNYN